MMFITMIFKQELDSEMPPQLIDVFDTEQLKNIGFNITLTDVKFRVYYCNKL